MGDIVRKVDICGLTAEGKKLRCSSVDALIDPGATKTVISEALSRRLGGRFIKGIPATIEGRKVPLKLTAIALRASGCDASALTVVVDDKLVGRAGNSLEMILGHDYLQRKYVALQYAEREEDHLVACRKNGNGKRNLGRTGILRFYKKGRS